MSRGRTPFTQVYAGFHNDLNGKSYLFNYDRYVRYDPTKGRIDRGYPKETRRVWKDFPFHRVDAAFYHGPRKKIYVFQNDQYARLDAVTFSMDSGYPKKTAQHWRGMSLDTLEGAFWYPENNKIYFFSKDTYIRFDVKTSRADPGYPKNIRRYWKGVPYDHVRGCYYNPLNKRVYFFDRNEYVRYNPKISNVDKGYPAAVPENFHGMPTKNGMYLSRGNIRELIEDKLDGKLQSDCHYIFSDKTYFCPELEDAKKIIDISIVETRKYRPNVFDCDDFAFLLKADFIKAAYNDEKRKIPYCMGMVHGYLPGPHAINWLITSDWKLHFIEPQSDSVFAPRATDKKIYNIII